LPRELTYFVELTNSKGRSAGLSNGAVVLAGSAPEPVAGLRIDVRKEGVELHWSADSTQAAVRLQRTRLTPTNRASAAGRGPLAQAPEPVEETLLVENGSQAGGGIDKSVHFGESYEYRAQHMVRVQAGGHNLELEGELSAPVRVDVLDIFPPATPEGLAAVATMAGRGARGEEVGPSIDLSWQPGTETDLAGYFVYRREGTGPWQRISPEQPVVTPAFHDANVVPGHTYAYAVSAVDQKGHESARSAEAHETVPSE